jgi:chromosome partitioning protein
MPPLVIELSARVCRVDLGDLAPGPFRCRSDRLVHGSTVAGGVRAREYRELVPARIYAIANQKGGVGKTTTAVNLAACLAEAGEPALLVDLDPQANATSGLGAHVNGTSTHDLLDGVSLMTLARPTGFPNLELVPARTELAAAAVELAVRDGGERYLADALDGATDSWSFVFLDCPPSFGPLTVNALAAADRVLVPVQAEYYALEGLSQLLGSIELVKRRLNPQLGLAGILLTMVDGRTRLAAEVEAELRRHFGDLVFATTVPRSVRLAEAPSHGLPAIAYDRHSAGAQAYWKVVMELVERA